MTKLLDLVLSCIKITIVSIAFLLELPFKLSCIVIGASLWLITAILYPIMNRIINACKPFQRVGDWLINYAFSTKFYFVDWAYREWNY